MFVALIADTRNTRGGKVRVASTTTDASSTLRFPSSSTGTYCWKGTAKGFSTVRSIAGLPSKSRVYTSNSRLLSSVLLGCSRVLGRVGAPNVQVFLVARRYHGDVLIARYSVQSRAKILHLLPVQADQRNLDPLLGFQL